MTVSVWPADLAERIQYLLQERQEHADALASIERVLAGIDAALGNGSGGQLAAPKPAAAPAAAQAPALRRGGRRHRGAFAVTGDNSIMSFVKERRNPTNREIEEHWKGEGRGGAAANMLSKMVKSRRLKRTPLKDQRGSRYSLA